MVYVYHLELTISSCLRLDVVKFRPLNIACRKKEQAPEVEIQPEHTTHTYKRVLRKVWGGLADRC